MVSPRLSRRLAGAIISLAIAPSTASAPPLSVATGDWGGPSITDIVEAKTLDGLSIAPDGRHLAYRLISRSVSDNRTIVQWYAQSLEGPGAPMAISRKTEPTWNAMFSLIHDGVGLWAPDSRAVYVLEEEHSQVQVHRLTLDGADVAVTSDAADVESFALSVSGDRLDYQTRAPRSLIDAAQARQRDEGLHFDRTVATEGFPLFGNARIGERQTTLRRISDNDVTGEVGAGPLVTRSVNLPATPGIIPTTAVAPGLLHLAEGSADKTNLELGSSKTRLRVRAIGSAPSVNAATVYQLVADLPDGRTIACHAFFCTGTSSDLRELIANPDTHEAVLLYEHDAAARSALYAWNPQSGRIRTIHSETGSLDGGPLYSGTVCAASGPSLVCVESGPTRPQRLIKIDLHSGQVTTLFDPNANLAAKQYPATRFLTWKDAQGNNANGILVLPFDRRIQKPPLVITSYRCRGYLSGGTAWLVPEFVLAERGIAALCVNFNTRLAAEPADGSPMPPLGPHKAAQAAYAAIITKLGDEGIIDTKKVGVAGHSFSGNVVTYAISHSNLFQAAVIGSGVTIDPGTYPMVAPAADSWRKAVYDFLGLPKPQEDPKGLWKNASPALNATAVRAPLLMQPPENEYLFDLQYYAYAQDAGAPTDMYVYPGEGHFASMMPVHQYWRSRRSVDWFDFWLNGREHRTPDTDDQYQHWEALRSSAAKRDVTVQAVTAAAP